MIYVRLFRPSSILNSSINHQTNKDCEISSMQPHHDTRGNDLKNIYLFSDFNVDSSSLLLRGSNNNIKLYVLEKHHRRKDLRKEQMDKIYGKKRYNYFWLTDGTHTQKNTTERTVLDITLILIIIF